MSTRTKDITYTCTVFAITKSFIRFICYTIAIPPPPLSTILPLLPLPLHPQSTPPHNPRLMQKMVIDSSHRCTKPMRDEVARLGKGWAEPPPCIDPSNTVNKPPASAKVRASYVFTLPACRTLDQRNLDINCCKSGLEG